MTKNTKVGLIIGGVLIAAGVASLLIKVKIQSASSDSWAGKYCEKNPESRDEETGNCKAPLLYKYFGKGKKQ